ncbi:MAG: hypothetical protein ACYTAF_17455 [Planctomycetota bacterium]|jgi:hypothetical protein
MARKLVIVFLLVVMAVAFNACAVGGDSVFHRGWAHVQWHILGAYTDL